MNTATIDELAYLINQAKKENLPLPIVFLGAGASKSGGIPLASEIAKDILEKYKDNPKIKTIEEKDKTYSKLMECLTPYERNKVLNEYIDKAKINVTHIYLAQLLYEGYIDYVLTVNFDNLMLRALALFNVFPATYDLSNLKDLTTSCFKEKSVVYLHGQHHGLWLLNTTEEMNKINEIIPPTLNSIKNQRPWIFIGYSGDDPIFDHILKLGRFDNCLYWTTYYDNNPNEKVCRELLEKANTNAFLIKGYDADSFMLKLNSELKLSQPLIINKPFTFLKNTLDNIVDIDDKEHFKGVKERLDIVKNDVHFAIKRFEFGNLKPDKKTNKELIINILKKRIIDIIVNNDFKSNQIRTIIKEAKTLNNGDVNQLLAKLFDSWGSLLSNNAKLAKDASLYKISFKKFEEAVTFNPNDFSVYNNWGTSILNYGRLTNDETYFNKSFEKYKKATELNPKYDISFNNWGGAIADLAKIRKDEKLYYEALDKFKIAASINSRKSSTFYNWGTALQNFADYKKDKKLFIQSFEKFKKATELNPREYLSFYNWGVSIFNLAKLNNDELLYKQCIEKYKKSTELNSKHYSAFLNWGIALFECAMLNKEEKLFEQCFEILKIATELEPENYLAYDCWGNAINYLAILKNDSNLLRLGLEKQKKVFELSGKIYNLACTYSLMGEKNKAFQALEKSLENGEISSSLVEKDDDWKTFIIEDEFTSLLKKYSQ